MARRDRTAERLAAIAASRDDPEGSADVLREALRSKIGIVAGAAAEVVAAARYEPLIAALRPAFVRLLDDPIRRDPQCRGKVAIVRALINLDERDDDVLAAALGHVQLEPGWEGAVDTAAELRGLAAIGCAQLGHPDAVVIAADTLADREVVARVGAAQALGDSGRLEAIPLLRYKARAGDLEPEVTAAVLSSLLALDPEGSLDRVVELLEGSEPVAELAALALGESRLEAALVPLIAWCDGAIAERRRVGYLAIAVSRLEPGVEHLLAVVAGDPDGAPLAVDALATFAHDRELGERVRAAASQSGDPEIIAAAAAAFA